MGAAVKSAFASSDTVADLAERAKELDARGRRSRWNMPGGPERVQATELLRSAVPPSFAWLLCISPTQVLICFARECALSCSGSCCCLAVCAPCLFCQGSDEGEHYAEVVEARDEIPCRKKAPLWLSRADDEHLVAVALGARPAGSASLSVCLCFSPLLSPPSSFLLPFPSPLATPEVEEKVEEDL